MGIWSPDTSLYYSRLLSEATDCISDMIKFTLTSPCPVILTRTCLPYGITNKRQLSYSLQSDPTLNLCIEGGTAMSKTVTAKGCNNLLGIHSLPARVAAWTVTALFRHYAVWRGAGIHVAIIGSHWVVSDKSEPRAQHTFWFFRD